MHHGVPAQALYAHLFLPNGKEPTCACGCGESTTFLSLQRGYTEYIRGHASRVKNNWGNNEKAREKSIETRRREGLWGKNPWNKGKTKESDPEFAEMCQNAYGSVEERQRRSSTMSKQWKDGSLVAATGANHSQWKGGASSVGALCHGSRRLYRSWKYPALERAGFKCERCAETRDLHVHHSDMRMSEIIRICAPDETDPSWEEQSAWVERVIDWHVQNMPSAEVLCQGCHAEEHPSLNFTS
jgi:hypothetical protein